MHYLPVFKLIYIAGREFVLFVYILIKAIDGDLAVIFSFLNIVNIPT